MSNRHKDSNKSLLNSETHPSSFILHDSGHLTGTKVMSHWSIPTARESATRCDGSHGKPQISQPVAPPHTGHKHTSYPTQQSLHPIGPQLKASNPNTRNRKVSTYMQTINRLRWFHRLWNESYLVQAPTQNRSSPHHFLTLPSLFWKQTVSLPSRTLPKQSIISIIYSSRADFNTFWMASNVASYGPMAFCLQWPSGPKQPTQWPKCFRFFYSKSTHSASLGSLGSLSFSSVGLIFSRGDSTTTSALPMEKDAATLVLHIAITKSLSGALVYVFQTLHPTGEEELWYAVILIAIFVVCGKRGKYDDVDGSVWSQNAAKLRHLGSFHLGDPKSFIQHVLCFQNIKCILQTWRCCRSSFAYAPQLALCACFQFKWPQL